MKNEFMLSNKRKYKVTALDLYLSLICIFPITTMLVDGTIINKLLFALLFSFHILSFFTKPIKRRTVLLLLILVLHYLYVLFATDFPITNYNLLFYFPFFLMYMYFMYDEMDEIVIWIKKRKIYIEGILVVWAVLVGISIFVPSCYYIKEGGSLYFGSWCNDIFRLGPSAVFIQVLAILLQTIHEKKRALLYMIIPLYCGMMGSSRAYLVAILCLFVISWYHYCNSHKVFWATAIPGGLVLLFLISISSMRDKIEYTLDASRFGDFWFRITSSRSLLWELDLEAWSGESILKKFFGVSLDFTNAVSGRWAHNDFIEILCSFGIVGVITYLAAIRRLLRKCFERSNVPALIQFLVVMVWLFNAFFNMHYVYFCAMLSYPLLPIVLRQNYKMYGTQGGKISKGECHDKEAALLNKY